ncbi:hypothetical protein [Cryptosporangium aurantiacum]|nr:hypothetical protein [Cryptosporangium aurantiacum]
MERLRLAGRLAGAVALTGIVVVGAIGLIVLAYLAICEVVLAYFEDV